MKWKVFTHIGGVGVAPTFELRVFRGDEPDPGLPWSFNQDFTTYEDALAFIKARQVARQRLKAHYKSKLQQQR